MCILVYVMHPVDGPRLDIVCVTIMRLPHSSDLENLYNYSSTTQLVFHTSLTGGRLNDP